MHHIIKIEQNYYEEKVAGNKLFEHRYNADKGFQKGDTVSYETQGPSGTWRLQDGTWEITYVCNYKTQPDWVIFGERLLEEKESTDGTDR